MHKIIINFGLIGIMLMSGCVTYPNRITQETNVKVKTVGIADEIPTPTSLKTPGNANAGQAGPIGILIDAGIQTGNQKDFTTQVRERFDFQKFAEETLRESFTQAVKNRSGWTLAASNSRDKTDAEFVLRVTEMGVDDYHSHSFFFPILEYQPTITVTATLIGNPPVEIVGYKGNSIKVLNPEQHPILYHRMERISYRTSGHMESPAAHSFVTHNGLMVQSWKYSGDAQLTKAAFREAINLAVKRIADSWTVNK